MEKKPLNQELFDEPYRFEFFQAVGFSKKYFPNAGRRTRGFNNVGSRALPFTPRHLIFPPAKFTNYKELPIDEKSDEQRLEMFVNFMGMIGVSGVMPTHYTELAMERSRYSDTAMWSFMDIFTHRAVSMFFRAWEKYRFPVGYERGKDDFTEFSF